MDFKVFLVFLIVAFCDFSSASLPRSIRTCPADKNFDNCLKQVLEEIKPNLVTGDFGDGFKVIAGSPIVFPSLTIPEVGITLSNMQFTGATNFKVLNLKSDLQKLEFDLTLLTPQTVVQSKYEIKQKLPALNVDLHGNGDIHIIFNKMHSRMRVRFMVVGDRIKLKKVQYKLKIDDARFNIDSLKNLSDKTGQSSKLFTEIANNFVNSDPAFVLRKIEPKIQQLYSSKLQEIIETLFRDVKVSDFFAS
ncbi:uncharacterized protein LOC134833315 [Culicoides brevitarsis]|uniref:uncharacterized protein LOC134833315 n=1 Tax=Culicoides brevitarsis TaxID=469753 RepID=UPI00307C76ED